MITMPERCLFSMQPFPLPVTRAFPIVVTKQIGFAWRCIYRCGYTDGCWPMPVIDFTVQNNNADAASVVRLSVTRNFPTREFASLPGRNKPSAEITGFNAMLLDEDNKPTGVLYQIWLTKRARCDEALLGSTSIHAP